ncbi:guanine nucleotide-binding protein subunit beta-like protein [Podospora aff. communis PSN243]|uniref:Guanine nucleotide-binding protein subunit beta-like protein n=1 Tax=Podospora aff. communis PSN243 TaxID=3040156 RepID=A0AAV9G682_9PEZI|nr:guanine nucleotide-binding protein subunit beta-like protein [Podospora aff. communis PSN243]
MSNASSSGRQRKWDDPPEKEPEYPPAHITTMILVQKNKFGTVPGFEVEQIGFTNSDAHLVCRVPPAANISSRTSGVASSQVVMYDVNTIRRKFMRPGPSNGIRTQGDFAVNNGSGLALMATAFSRTESRAADDRVGAAEATPGVPRVEVYDLFSDKRRIKADFALRSPLAIVPDGSYLACTSARNPNRIVILDIRNENKPTMSRVIQVHSSPLTHMAVTPDGTALISASTDGSIRMTSLQSGRTLRKAEVDSRVPASMMQLSMDGDLVVSVWGRQVYSWRLNADTMSVYSLDKVRESEGWPLAISPDCQHLACRTEDGIDVIDVATGVFRSDFPLDPGHALITSAGFSHNNRWLALGDYDGRVTVLEVITDTIDGSC